MAAARLRATDYLLWTAALAWPLGVFLQTPFPGVDFLTFIAILLLPLVLPDVLAERKLRIPFEFVGPATVLAFLVALWSWSDPRPLHRDTAKALLLFALVLQIAPSRNSIHRYIFAGVCGFAIVSLISLLASWLPLLPTAYTFRSLADLTFPHTMAEGVHMLLIGASSAVYVAKASRSTKWQRIVAGIVIFQTATLLVARGAQWWRDTGVLPVVAYPPMWAGQWAAAGLAVWIPARAIAKVEVNRRASPDPLHLLWWTVGIITLLVAAFVPLHPRGYQGLVLGLAAATAMSPRTDVRAARWPIVGSIVSAAFLGVNLFFVFPSNTSDPRQYDAAAQREMPRVFDRMDWVDRHAPNERRTYLWRARAAMEAGLPNLASFAFARATRPSDGPTILAPPTEVERQEFIVHMRDIAAALPEDRAVCAYERVLLAAGERDAALYSLRLRTAIPLIHVSDPDAESFIGVASMILGDPSLVQDMRNWFADEVLTVLSQWGTDVAFATDAAEAPGGTFVLAAQRTWDALNVIVRAGERVTHIVEPLPPVTEREIRPLTEVSVMVWAGPSASNAAGAVRYTLNVAARDVVRPAAYVDLHGDGTATFSWAADRPVIAFTPAVRVRLAK